MLEANTWHSRSCKAWYPTWSIQSMTVTISSSSAKILDWRISLSVVRKISLLLELWTSHGHMWGLPSLLARFPGGFSKISPLPARGTTTMAMSHLRSLLGISDTWRSSCVSYRRKKQKGRSIKTENSLVLWSGHRTPEPCGCICSSYLASMTIAAFPSPSYVNI